MSATLQAELHYSSWGSRQGLQSLFQPCRQLSLKRPLIWIGLQMNSVHLGSSVGNYSLCQKVSDPSWELYMHKPTDCWLAQLGESAVRSSKKLMTECSSSTASFSSSKSERKLKREINKILETTVKKSEEIPILREGLVEVHEEKKALQNLQDEFEASKLLKTVEKATAAKEKWQWEREAKQ